MRITFIILAIFSLAACSSTTPTVQQGPGAEVTFDGLHRVNDSRADRIWIKPDIDLSKYDALMFASAGIQYSHPDAKSRYDRNADTFPLSEKQKQLLIDTVSEAMTKELSKIEHYSIADTAGPGVLEVTIGLMDVSSKIPEDFFTGRSNIYLNSLGAATLVVELRDSRTEEALARMVDRQQIEPVVMRESTPPANKMEVSRYARNWGARLRAGLDELHELGCFVCNVPGDIKN